MPCSATAAPGAPRPSRPDKKRLTNNTVAPGAKATAQPTPQSLRAPVETSGAVATLPRKERPPLFRERPAMRLPRLRTALLLLAAALPAGAAQQFQAGDYTLGPDSTEQPDVPKGKVTQSTWKSEIFAGTTRDYWVYVPAQYDPKKP